MTYNEIRQQPPSPKQENTLPDSGRESERLRRQRIIFQVDEGHNSKETAYKYRNNFRLLRNYFKIHDLDVLLDLGKGAIQELVIKYVKSLRDDPIKKYKRATVDNRITAILYFFENNDIELNKRKIRRYYPPDESTNADRPYTTDEIQRILSVCDLRTKAMILLMASTGVRVGSLPSMQISDLRIRVLKCTRFRSTLELVINTWCSRHRKHLKR
jgi:integrase